MCVSTMTIATSSSSSNNNNNSDSSKEFMASRRDTILLYSEVPRGEIFGLGVLDLIVSLAYVVYVWFEFGDCCAWLLVLPAFHLWIWLYAFGVSNVRLGSLGFVYGYVGLVALSFVVDIVIAIIILFVSIDDMEWNIIVLYGFFFVLGLLCLAHYLTSIQLANSLWKEVRELEQRGLRVNSRRSLPIRGLVAVWISFDVFLFIVFWFFAAITLRSCCWWIILFALPHGELWLAALASANSRVQKPWLFMLYLALAILATFLDLSAFVLSALWFSDTGEFIYLIWALLFSFFMAVDTGNLLFSANQLFAIQEEADREIHAHSD